MFVAFLIQIVFRYVLNWPVGWTSEVSTAMWLWAVLWGAAFVVDEREEIRFDIVYVAVGVLTFEPHPMLEGYPRAAIRRKISWRCTSAPPASGFAISRQLMTRIRTRSRAPIPPAAH